MEKESTENGPISTSSNANNVKKSITQLGSGQFPFLSDQSSLQQILSQMQQCLTLAQQHKIPLSSTDSSINNTSSTRIKLKLPQRVKKEILEEEDIDYTNPSPPKPFKKKTTVKVTIPSRFLTKSTTTPKNNRSNRPKRIHTPDLEQIKNNPPINQEIH